MKTESTSSKWRAGPSGKGDRSRVTDKEAYDQRFEQAFGKRPCPLEERDLSWLDDEKEQEGNTDDKLETNMNMDNNTNMNTNTNMKNMNTTTRRFNNNTVTTINIIGINLLHFYCHA